MTGLIYDWIPCNVVDVVVLRGMLLKTGRVRHLLGILVTVTAVGATLLLFCCYFIVVIVIVGY